MDTLLQDIRYAFRALAKTPGFTIVAVLTLALGIGANTAIFSAVHGVLLKPLPYREAGRVYMALESTPAGGLRPPSYPTFVDWEAQQDAFVSVAFARGRGALYRSSDGPRSFPVAYVSSRFFETLGLETALGRPLAAEDARGSGHVVVLSHRLWRSWFTGDPGILGRHVTLGDASYEVVGVAAPAARYPDWAEAWIPMAAIQGQDAALIQRGLHADSRVIARLKADVSLEQATARLGAIAARQAVAHPASNAGWTSVRLVPLRFEVLGFDNSAATRLAVLMGAVALVLLIACANVTNLLLARALGRSRELAIRVALGARRGRLARQLLTESGVLATIGAALGVALAFGLVSVLKHAVPTALPRFDEVNVNLIVLSFSAGAALVVALLVSIAPALRSTPLSLTAALKSGAAASLGSAPRLRRALVTAEIALSLVLAMGAGLLAKSLWRLGRVDPGFDPRGIVVLGVAPSRTRNVDAAAAAEFYRRLHEAVRAAPGVRAAALMNHLPLTGAGLPSRLLLPGESVDPADTRDRSVYIRTVSADLFATLAIPIRRGRAFERADLNAGAVAVLNETAARRFFPDREPIGATVTLFKSAQGRPDFGQPYQATVVGIAADIIRGSLTDAPPADVYIPYTVNPWGFMTVVVRAAGEPGAVVPELRRALLAVDPDIAVAGWGPSENFRSADELFAAVLEPQRLNTGLLASFAVVALLLATVGVYGLISFHVTQRTREIGLRVALGAQPGDVTRLVLREATRLGAVGVALGSSAALATNKVLRSMLFETSPTDAVTLLSVAVLLTAVGLVAAYVPARRAAKIEPIVALRSE